MFPNDIIFSNEYTQRTGHNTLNSNVLTSDGKETLYETVELMVLDENGNNINGRLDTMFPFTCHAKTRNKRDTDSKDLNNLRLNFKTYKADIELILNPLHRSMALTATIEWVGKNGSTIKPLQTGCLFEGTARNHTDSVGVFSVCGGIVSTSSFVFHNSIHNFR